MLARLESFPLFVVLLGVAAVSMLAPAVIGYISRDLFEARVFFYLAILLSFLTAMIGLAARKKGQGISARAQLLTLLAAYALLPVVFAVPFYEALRTTTFVNAYFEMVSAFTTTGATVFDVPERLSAPLHLWCAQVAWMGGLFIWITAIAVLSPMNLGGFEVSNTQEAAQRAANLSQFSKSTAPAKRLARHAVQLTPIYVGLTAVMALILILAGDTPLVAVTHAMGVISTSGISAVGGVENANSGFVGEFVLLLFMVFALSRLTFSNDFRARNGAGLMQDPEMRLAAVVIIAIPVVLFLRHWFGAFEVNSEENFAAAVRAIWGSVFTVVSFLTTTGYESSGWSSAQNWSGLSSPGLILMGLALLGGGVATTAGGVKLLRVYALYKHGLREMTRLVHPNSVSGAAGGARHIRREGAFIAWIFFMLFALSLAFIMLALSWSGLTFETSMALSVAALSTTGPLANVATDAPIAYSGLPNTAKMILSAAMVLGRLETLAIIALLNPEFWRS
ncbi:TrkH family potassium uptake protein [Nereida sp. MMG025]|uniref:TrkH family potassium uptake protein n=1 Tax=Nereida sp. MMG025 TaxID=2909981 RepID=UPI001F329584|nr:potassium transporter TrkG [Nereida sp. MMG025]MCF6443276.1 TrkH family potassium uptake protein [Nereida sp. MMG025]